MLGFTLSWPETRELFLQYVKFKRYEPANARNLIGYLDRFVTQPIRGPFRCYEAVFALDCLAEASFKPRLEGLV